MKNKKRSVTDVHLRHLRETNDYISQATPYFTIKNIYIFKKKNWTLILKFTNLTFVTVWFTELAFKLSMQIMHPKEMNTETIQTTVHTSESKLFVNVCANIQILRAFCFGLVLLIGSLSMNAAAQV